MRLHPRAVRLLPLLLPVLLLPARGEALGERLAGPGCTPTPEQVGSFANSNARITELVEVDGTLFFSANDGSGFRLWKLAPGATAPQVLNPLAGPWPANVESVSKLTAMGRRLFFVVKFEVAAELWITDEGHTGIQRVRSLSVSLLQGDDPEFTVVGSTLFFRLDNDGSGLKLWMSDGATAEPVPLNNNNNESIDRPAELTAFNGRLFFQAFHPVTGVELWSSAQRGVDARLFADLREGAASSAPGSLTVMKNNLYFTATTMDSSDANLWVARVTEGRVEPPVVAVDSNTLGQFHGPLEQLTAVDDKLFFLMSRSETGQELWVSDGTEAGTGMVKEIQVGPSDGRLDHLTAVGRMLFFMADDSLSGPEPWRSDGTANGTFKVANFTDDTADPFAEMKAGPGVLLLAAYTSTSGTELWSISDTAIQPLTDIVPGMGSSNPQGMTIVGRRLYFAATARQGDLGQELFFLDLTEVDCNNPVAVCPGDLTVEAVSPAGALVFLPPPRQMSDDSFTPLAVTFSPAPLGLFPLDTPTTATLTVTDMAGRAGTCSFLVTVRDTQGPRLVCPASMVVEATEERGANVSLSVEAADVVSGVSSVEFSRESSVPGTFFELNQTDKVTVTATDGGGRRSQCEFSVTVKDTVPPRLTCPLDIVRVATSAEPVHIAYPRPQLERGATLVERSEPPSPGDMFEVGMTKVELTAVDPSGNGSTCRFSVHLVDPVAPTITCPGPQQVVATGPEGAVVEFPEAVAEDALSTPTIRYSPEPGSTFPVGETTVTATASDVSENEASCSFTVTVTEPGKDGPLAGCGCRAGSASASVYWLLLALAPLWARRRAGRLAR